MDEDLAIISENTKKEQIKRIFYKHKNKIYFIIGLIVLLIFSSLFYLDNLKKKKIKIANQFIQNSLNYNKEKRTFFYEKFKEIIDTHDSTYTPLALFFVVDNKVTNSRDEINNLFDQVLENTKMEKEIKNLVMYKKALVNVEDKSENEIIKILNPILTSESFWKPHSLLLLGDYFLNKGEKQKAYDFYNKIFISKKINENILRQAQSRIQRHYAK